MRTPAEVIARLGRGPTDLRAVLADVPAKDLKRRPAPARWSAHEHACHLALMEPRWLERVELIVAADAAAVPTIVNYEPDADEPPDRLLAMDLENALEDFTEERARLLARLETLPPGAWVRKAIHTGHARYSLFLMCRHAALHDGLHIYRVEESALGTHWPSEGAAR